MFRIDRFLTLYLLGPLTKRLKSRGNFHIPILMYHSISDDPEDGIQSYYKINTSPKRFTDHMKYLYDNNYKVIDLPQAVRLIESPSSDNGIRDERGQAVVESLHPTPPTLNANKYVVLTFDDGYRDFYTRAFRLLKKYDFSATVFLPTSFIDSGRKPGLKEKEHLSWEEVGELQKEGIIFGSHTVTHPQLRLLAKNEIEYEVKKSKEVIEDRITQPVDSFSYPYAFPQEDGGFKKNMRNLLERCGYKQGVTTIIGRSRKGDNCFLLKRLPLSSDDDLRLFKAKLEGGYDWLINPQRFYKFLYKIKDRSIWKSRSILSSCGNQNSSGYHDAVKKGWKDSS
jgi:peptidoglycan/xylan/chitin deacetylase (PgdA/CDA1 family)